MSLRFPSAKWAIHLAGLSVLAILGACGGGDSPPPTPPTPATNFAVGDVLIGLATRGGQFTVSRTDSAGALLTMTVSYAPGETGRFARITSIVSSTGEVIAPREFRFVFEPSPFQIRSMSELSQSASSGDLYTLPVTSAVGSRGRLFSANSPLLIAFNYDWTLEQKSSGTASLCFNIFTGSSFGAMQNLQDCFEIDARGTILGLKSIFDQHIYHFPPSTDIHWVYE